METTIMEPFVLVDLLQRFLGHHELDRRTLRPRRLVLTQADSLVAVRGERVVQQVLRRLSHGPLGDLLTRRVDLGAQLVRCVQLARRLGAFQQQGPKSARVLLCRSMRATGT